MGNVHLDPQALTHLASTTAIPLDVVEQIAANVRAQGIMVGDEDGGPLEIPLPVTVTTGGADTGARVVLAHAAGQAVQAKHGVLTKAAAAAGLQVTAK